MDKNCVQHSSTGARAGVNVDGIIEHSEVMETPMTLDSRGGDCDHLDMSAALHALMINKSHTAQSRKISRCAGVPFELLPELFAVKLRVMRSRIRIKLQELTPRCACQGDAEAPADPGLRHEAAQSDDASDSGRWSGQPPAAAKRREASELVPDVQV